MLRLSGNQALKLYQTQELLLHATGTHIGQLFYLYTSLFFCSTQTNFWILLKHTDENTKKVSPLPLSLCLSVNAFLFSKAKIRHLTDDVGI